MQQTQRMPILEPEASYAGISKTSSYFGAPQLSGGAAIIANSAQIQFGVVPSASGAIAHAGLKPAQSGGIWYIMDHWQPLIK